MTITRTQCSCPAAIGWLPVVLLAWLSIAPLAAADLELATLKSGTEIFTNVTVYGQTETDLFIKHSRGFGNVKISSLDHPTLRLLKLEGGTPEEETAGAASGPAAATVTTLKAKLSSLPWKIPSEADVLGVTSRVHLTPNIMAIVVIVYLLFCVGMKLICLNAGSQPGLMIWIPVLQMFPLLRAAKMTAWWFVVFLIPPFSLVAHLVWCVKIAKACGKGGLVALLLILPVTNLLAFLYLALSNGDRPPAEKVIGLQGQRVVLGET